MQITYLHSFYMVEVSVCPWSCWSCFWLNMSQTQWTTTGLRSSLTSEMPMITYVQHSCHAVQKSNKRLPTLCIWQLTQGRVQWQGLCQSYRLVVLSEMNYRLSSASDGAFVGIMCTTSYFTWDEGAFGTHETLCRLLSKDLKVPYDGQHTGSLYGLSQWVSVYLSESHTLIVTKHRTCHVWGQPPTYYPDCALKSHPNTSRCNLTPRCASYITFKYFHPYFIFKLEVHTQNRVRFCHFQCTSFGNVYILNM